MHVYRPVLAAINPAMAATVQQYAFCDEDGMCLDAMCVYVFLFACVCVCVYT